MIHPDWKTASNKKEWTTWMTPQEVTLSEKVDLKRVGAIWFLLCNIFEMANTKNLKIAYCHSKNGSRVQIGGICGFKKGGNVRSPVVMGPPWVSCWMNKQHIQQNV